MLVVSVAHLCHTDEIGALDRYTFLGYTESQLKATQFMMFEGDKAATQNLLRTFGKLDAVYQKSGYGKYAARLGLSFSSTAVGLDAWSCLLFV